MKDTTWFLAGLNNDMGFLKPEFELYSRCINGIILGPLNKINLFVGANNSGKSRLMRRIIANNNLHWVEPLEGLTLIEIVDNIIRLIKEIKFHNPRVVVSPNVSESKYPNLRKAVDLLSNYRRYFSPNNYIEIDFRDHLNDDLGKTLQDQRNWWRPSSPATNIDLKINKIFLENTKLKPEANENWKDYLKGISVALNLLTVVLKLTRHEIDILNSHNQNQIPKQILPLNTDETLFYNSIESLKKKISLLCNSDITVLATRKYHYIPVLRSIIRLDIQEKPSPYYNEIFIGTVKTNYANELNNSVLIHTGQDFYRKFLEARNGKKKLRENFEAFEKFLSDEFFGSQEIDIVAEVEGTKEKTIIVHLGNEEHEIHQLGDGIQAIIMLTFPIFMAENNSFIFIEEPELNLHPGMQRVFLEVLTKNEFIQQKNLTFFFTTHSNHFLDLTLTENAPVSIFTLRKKHEVEEGKPVFEIRNVRSGDKDLLDVLGVQNSSVYVGNCSIWIEGVTDRKYIRRCLEAYMASHSEIRHYKEDQHYVFFEYSGSNLSHYSFEGDDKPSDDKIKALRLNNRIMVVADQDSEKKAKHDFFSSLPTKNFYYHPLRRAREIENLLHPDLVQEAIPVMFPTLASKASEKIKSLSWKNSAAFVTEPLFNSIKKAIGLADFAALYPKSSKSKTLPTSAKMALCDFACAEDRITWDTMTEEAQELTKEIYKFIADSNNF